MAAPDDDVVVPLINRDTMVEGLRLIQMVRCEVGKKHLSLDLTFQMEKVERLFYELYDQVE
jgi:hypothetical protein